MADTEKTYFEYLQFTENGPKYYCKDGEASSSKSSPYLLATVPYTAKGTVSGVTFTYNDNYTPDTLTLDNTDDINLYDLILIIPSQGTHTGTSITSYARLNGLYYVTNKTETTISMEKIVEYQPLHYTGTNNTTTGTIEFYKVN